jgi:hypothetical protein
MIRAATLLAIWLTGPIVMLAGNAISAPPTVDLRPTNRQITAQNIPRPTIRKIQLDIQKRYKVPLNQIKLINAQARTWDGCMGLAKPNTACIEIAILGWQVIMSGPNNRFWIYHVDQSGNSLGINIDASLPNRSQIPAPRFIDRVIPPSEDNVLFQSAMITGEALTYDAIELRAEGDNGYLLTRRQLTPKIGKPQVIKRLTSQQVQPFLDLLNNNSFGHFDHISYFDNNKVAVDAPVFQLYGYGATTEYTAGDQDKLPTKLGAIVQAWENLTNLTK